MNKALRVTVAIFTVLAAGGCEQTRDMLGMNKSAPDEFAVYQRAPLSLPPDYGLRPPTPGVSRSQQVEPRAEAQEAIRAISGGQAQPAPAAASPGLQALLEKTGALNTAPGIRTVINRETSILAEEDQSFTERIMFWGTTNVYGSVVDPTNEARRIQENLALGRPLNEGEVPTIRRKRKALLEGIF